MSFILDALKKSENERQQQVPAEFSTVPSSQESPAVPRWLWILGALLVVNLLVVAAVLLRPASVTSATPVTPAAAIDLPAIEPPVAAKSSPTFTEQLEIARQKQPLQRAETEVPETETTRDTTIDNGFESAPAQNTRPKVQASDFAGLPALDELRLSGRIQLPEMRIDMHVYSDAPQSRFVFINGKKYREREKTSDGPVLREITRDGVILDHQGTRFALNK